MEKKTYSKSYWITVGVALLVFVVWISLEDMLDTTTAKEAEEEKEKHRKGFHCLSGWNGAHSAVEKYVEERMRDPDSFEHVETRISPVNDKGTHQLSMKYRAANGFGGLTVGSATATVDNESCQAKITSME
jgi:hypothetical protein